MAVPLNQQMRPAVPVQTASVQQAAPQMRQPVPVRPQGTPVGGVARPVTTQPMAAPAAQQGSAPVMQPGTTGVNAGELGMPWQQMFGA